MLVEPSSPLRAEGGRGWPNIMCLAPFTKTVLRRCGPLVAASKPGGIRSHSNVFGRGKVSFSSLLRSEQGRMCSGQRWRLLACKHSMTPGVCKEECKVKSASGS